jgi:hypothetical protein
MVPTPPKTKTKGINNVRLFLIYIERVMNPFEFNPSWYMFVTVMLGGIAAWYLWLIKLSFEYSKKETGIELIHRKLERFYIPIQNALFSIEGAEDDNRERYYILAKANALYGVVKHVKVHNLSSSELRLFIRRFSAKFHWFNYSEDLAIDDRMAYEEIVYLLDKIEELISRDIKEIHLKLNELRS